jgi:hypothetical protein
MYSIQRVNDRRLTTGGETDWASTSGKSAGVEAPGWPSEVALPLPSAFPRVKLVCAFSATEDGRGRWVREFFA